MQLRYLRFVLQCACQHHHRCSQHTQHRCITTHCAFFRTVKGELARRDPDAAPVAPFTYPELSDSSYGIPHIKAKPSLGLAISGGGFRAATCASGWMRGLHNTKLDDGCTALSKAKYLPTTSGGSWFNAAFSYKAPGDAPQTDLSTLFGHIMEPSQLTLEVLSKAPPKKSFDAAVAVRNTLDTLLGAMRGELMVVEGAHKVMQEVKALLHKEDVNGQMDQGRKQPDWVHPWTQAVTETFLTPYGLDRYTSTVSAAGTLDRFAEGRAAATGKDVLLACTNPDRPYPILMGSVFNHPGDDGYSIYPFEFTPLYFGTPSPFLFCSPPLGGGYVEPWGLHAVPGRLCPGDCDGSCVSGMVDVDFCAQVPKTGQPLHTVPLAQAASISSAFMAAAVHNRSDLAQKMASTEKLMNWGLLGCEDREVPACGIMGFADGGMVDNLGISALLRRGVKALIIMSAASEPPDDTWERYAAEACDVACWFGAAKACYTPGMTATELNEQCRVFAANRHEGEQLFMELFDDVHDKLRTGKPGFHRGRYLVHENHFQNIPARQEPVEVLWLFNHQWADWERSLPPDTHKQLLKDRAGPGGKEAGIHYKSVMAREAMEGEIKHGLLSPKHFLNQDTLYRFPYFTTFSLGYSNAATNMLSQLSSAVIMYPEVQQHIKELLEIAAQP